MSKIVLGNPPGSATGIAGKTGPAAVAGPWALGQLYENAGQGGGMEPVHLLQRLIRFPSVNPPGNEAACVRYIADLLRQAGLHPLLVGKSPDRQNLVVRLTGKGLAPPFLMYGHADVVGIEGQQWRYPPFAGVEAEGFVWGRGALDMKGGLAMMISALLRLTREGFTPAGDIILAVVCDEEDQGAFGAQYLTAEHAGLFRGVRYAISELGGFSICLAGRRLYPIMVSEKQRCSLRVKIAGPGGHSSLAARGGIMAVLARILQRLDRRPLPVHITPPVRIMLEAIASALPFPVRPLPWLLSKPFCAEFLLARIDERLDFFKSLFRNTATPTAVRGGSRLNLVPSEILLDLDGRLVPGFRPETLIREIRNLLQEDVEIDLIHFLPGPMELDMGLFSALSAVLQELDPQGRPVPFVGSGVSDARFFCTLGVQTFGFTPMLLPPEIDFAKLVHGADERIPVPALHFGAEAVYRLLKRL